MSEYRRYGYNLELFIQYLTENGYEIISTSMSTGYKTMITLKPVSPDYVIINEL